MVLKMSHDPFIIIIIIIIISLFIVGKIVKYR